MQVEDHHFKALKEIPYGYHTKKKNRHFSQQHQVRDSEPNNQSQ